MKKRSIKKSNLLIIILSFIFCLSIVVAIFPVYAENINKVKPSDIIHEGVGITGFQENFNVGSKEGLKSYTGLYIKTKGNTASFSYKHEVDAKALHKEDALIDMAFLGLGEDDYSKAISAAIYLTDVENPENKVGVGFYPADDLGEADNGNLTYFRVIYNDKSVSYDLERERHWEGHFGLSAYWRSLYPGKFLGSQRYSFVIRFDYEEKAFYADTHNGTEIILDLDDELHTQGNIWNGFVSDKCVLSMEIAYETAKDGGVVVNKLFGRDISADYLNLENNVPQAFVVTPKEHTTENMPKAEVGTEYKIPELSIFDFVYGTADVQVVATRNGVDICDEIINGNLVASETGVVEIFYTVTNQDGKTAHAQLSIPVIEKLSPYVYTKSNDSEPILGEYFDIPKIEVSGGSGYLDVKEDVTYNGKSVDVSNGRTIYIDEIGSVAIRIDVLGYTGEKETRLFVFTVNSDKTNFIINAMPYTVKKGETLIIPDFKVVVPNGVAENKKVFVNNVDITTQMSYFVDENSGDSLSVRFCGGEGSAYSEKSYTVKVIEDTFSLTDYIYTTFGSAQIYNSIEESAVVLESNSDFSARFAYPVSLNNCKLNFTFDGSYIDSLDIVLTGYEKGNEQVFFRLTHLTSTTSALQVNGVGQVFILPVSFMNLSNYNLIIQNNEGAIYFGEEKVADYISLKSGGAKVELRLNDVYGKTRVLIKALSNQSFNPNAYYLGDMVAPYVYINGTMEKYKVIDSIGGYFEFPSAKAYDVLSDNATVKLKVLSPSKKVLYEGDISTSVKIKMEEYGVYVVDYIVKDVNRFENKFNYSIEIADKVSPIITVLKRPNAEYKKGDTIVLSNCQVNDNFDSNPIIEVFYKNVINGTLTLVTGDSIKLDESGVFSIIYRVRDSAYNVSRIEYSFKVVE